MNSKTEIPLHITFPPSPLNTPYLIITIKQLLVVKKQSMEQVKHYLNIDFFVKLPRSKGQL
jgi:hypothetical protein